MDFLNLARAGKNEWWRYVLALLAIIFIWLGASIAVFIALIASVMLDDDLTTRLNPETGTLAGVDSLVMFLVIMASAAGLTASVLFVTRFIHQRPIRSLITPNPRIDWKRVAVGFVFFFLLAALASVVEAVIFPGRYQLAFKPDAFFKFLPLVLILIPIQTTGEELFFRAYFLQALGLRIRNRWIAATISSLIFMALHLANPEVSADPILLPVYYFTVGMLFSLVTVRDNRLELALGAHAAVNIFTALIANYSVSALTTPSLFLVTTLDARFSMASFLVMAIVFYAGLFARRRAP
ncbi:MAG: CPBP family intramembrane metalloprotease [Chloroflexi bacterium]|nr:CPBP family intramembrane metalloprotease [Chloroflexota bacterium]